MSILKTEQFLTHSNAIHPFLDLTKIKCVFLEVKAFLKGTESKMNSRKGSYRSSSCFLLL